MTISQRFIIIFLLQFGGEPVTSASCDFSGQCIYNLKVHHCNQTTNTRRESDPSGNCGCGDLEIVQGETYNLQSSLSTLEAQFNALVQKYQATKASILQKQQLLENAISENKALESKIRSVDYLLNKTTESVTRQTNNWKSEKIRLQTQTSTSIKDLQTCKAVLTAAKTDNGHSIIDTSSNKPVSRTFCGFEDSKRCGYVTESGSHWTLQSSMKSSTTGPKQDHTYGTPNGHYMMLDSQGSASSSKTTHTSRVDSPQYSTSSTGYCVKFWYNMHGQDITFLKVYAKVNGGLGYPVFTKTGDVDSDWHQAQISLDNEYTSHPFQIVFESATNAYYTTHYSSGSYRYIYSRDQSNTAIDDVTVYNTSCNRKYYRHIYSRDKSNTAIDDVTVYNTSCNRKYYCHIYSRDKSNTAIDDVTVYNTSCNLYHFSVGIIVDLSKSSHGSHVRQNGSDTSYYSFHAKPLNWYDAYTACRSEDSQSSLVSINSQGEQDFLVRTIKNDENLANVGSLGFYTGGNDEKIEHNFVWTDTGASVTYTNWHPGQPNNVGGDQDCLLLQYPDNNFEWGDVGCSEKHPYICEYHTS
ncbi:unnamed protein product [Mytilus coruscus]|uniref:C-type lectin domain-containing protein n=1 Tax=Mytilus coruscus TaxID=42192 RepID=A0A6J8BWI9_MYTCO|nr:unnamed protein product [Mytilus coruscus]